MKTLKDLNNKKVPLVRIDPALNKFRDDTPFPDKLEKANAALKNAKLPKKKQRS